VLIARWGEPRGSYSLSQVVDILETIATIRRTVRSLDAPESNRDGGARRPGGQVMGVTLPETWLATQAVVPSGVMAMAKGLVPTVTAVPAVRVARVIGVTVFDP
jgi:hypothetical protein